MPDTPRLPVEFATLDDVTQGQCAATLSRIVSGMRKRLPRINQMILLLVAVTGCRTDSSRVTEVPMSSGDYEMKMPITKIPGRVAIRHEGHMVNAYWAKPDTMVGAFWLGSIPAYFVSNSDMFERWKKLMIDGAGFVIEDITGGKIEKWMEQAAPAHEKTKE